MIALTLFLRVSGNSSDSIALILAVWLVVLMGYVLNSLPQTITVKNGAGNSFISGGTGNSGSTGSGEGNDLVFLL